MSAELPSSPTSTRKATYFPSGENRELVTIPRPDVSLTAGASGSSRSQRSSFQMREILLPETSGTTVEEAFLSCCLRNLPRGEWVTTSQGAERLNLIRHTP